MKKLMLLLLFVSILASGQDSKENFVNYSFKEGMPKEIISKWENTFYASINGGEFFKAIYIISRDSLKTSNDFVILRTGNIGVSTSKIKFERLNESQYTSSFNLESDEEDKLPPLTIKINLKEKTLYYRWENIDKKEYEYPTILEEYLLKVGKIFPTIKVKTENGYWTNENSDKMIVINWWATSCRPCITEMPGLNKLVNKYKNKNIEFISIVRDEENLEDFLSKNKFLYRHGFKDEHLISLLGKAYPRNIIISSDGVILHNFVGASKDTYLELEKIIQSNL